LIGRTVSHYRILAKLGGGGMGLVYKAQDLRLDRLVALKFLRDDPDEDAPAPDLRRLLVEARAASALDHPNICTVYDIDQTEDGRSFIVMALYDGETLKMKIGRGPLKMAEAFDFAIQIAEALALAHSRGIIHRDVKPSNVIVTPEGQAKLLDFGVARLMGESRITRTGLALGTVAYMSPEQIRGAPSDHRADIWALGVVLYEMIAGRLPFPASDNQALVWAIQLREPEPLTGLRSGIPLALDRIVQKAMAKDPDDRYQHADEIPVDLRACRRSSRSSELLTAPTLVDSPLPSAARSTGPALRSRTGPVFRRFWKGLAVLSAGIAALLLVFWIAGGRSAGTKGAQPPSFTLLTFRRGTIRTARFSPDGQSIVYGAAWDGDSMQLFLTRPDSPQATALTLPPAELLAVSRSGEIALLTKPSLEGVLMISGVLARAPLLGDAAREVLENVREADWTPDGTDLLVVRPTASGEGLELPAGKILYRTGGFISHARFSPDGKRIAFLDHPVYADDRGDVKIMDLQGRKTTLSTGWASIRGLAWSPSGREIWFTATRTGEDFALYAVDLSGQERTLFTSPGSMILLDVARDGKILLTREEQVRQTTVRVPGQDEERDFTWLDLSAARFISDDGQRVLFTHFGHGSGANYSVYLRATQGGPGIRLGEGEARALSPDGRWAASIVHGSPSRILLLPTGAGATKTLESRLTVQAVRWFPDGHRLLLVGREPGRSFRSYVQDLRGGPPQPITPEGVSSLTWSPISPDGTMVIATGQDGRSALYPAGGGPPRAIQGLEPQELPVRWAADERAIFTQRSDGFPLEIFRIDLATGQRRLWKRIRPVDSAGLMHRGEVFLTPDGESYVYNSERLFSHLYLVEGIR